MLKNDALHETSTSWQVCLLLLFLMYIAFQTMLFVSIMFYFCLATIPDEVVRYFLKMLNIYILLFCQYSL